MSTAALLELVEAVRAIPYGRPSDRTVEGMLREQRGTCSTKHLFLARVVAERFPETAPRVIHRVYTLNRTRARELFGSVVAAPVPVGGLVDVHRYLTITLGAKRVEIDATFPGPPGTAARRWRSRVARGLTSPLAMTRTRRSGRSRSSTAIRPSGSRSSSHWRTLPHDVPCRYGHSRNAGGRCATSGNGYIGVRDPDEPPVAFGPSDRTARTGPLLLARAEGG